jgi:hypothetical protein
LIFVLGLLVGFFVARGIIVVVAAAAAKLDVAGIF